MPNASGALWETLFLAGTLSGVVLLAEAGCIGLFFGLLYGRNTPIGTGRGLAMCLALLGVIVVPPGGVLSWFSLSGQPPSPVLVARAAAAATSFSLGNASPERGKRLFQEQSCLACHRLQGRGGAVAPDLWGVANRRDAAWIFRHFQDPQAVSPGTLMPRFPLSDGEFLDLTAYLLTLRDRP
ncbi:MAG: cytochrome c [Chloroflexi bacterium]|nr:cytochrome c [Chloroflexota bacterium]